MTNKQAKMTESEEKFNYLYPDLLTKDELISILTKRYIKVSNIELCSKDELVELYNDYVLPLPQRKHRLNRRGRDMTKKQIIHAKKRKSTAILSQDKPEGEPPEKRPTVQLQNNIASTLSAGDRLKPPPSCVNFEKKTLKLNSASKSETVVSPISSSLNQLKINRISLDKSDSNEVERKTIKLKETEHPPQDGAKVDKKADEPSDKSSPMDISENNDDGPTAKKPKITRIAWP